MNTPKWFIKSGWFYLPKNFAGFAILAVFAASALLFLKIASHFSETWTSLVMHYIPVAGVLFFCYEWIAKKITVTQ